MKTVIRNYIAPNGLAILIRQHGGKAMVEIENGKEVVVTDRSLEWVQQICREANWICP